MSDTAYPNREHGNADRAARRRIATALSEIENEVAILRRKISQGTVDGDDTHILADRARQVTQFAAELGILRDVREWHAADRAQAAGHV